jgi:23S rRNA pseudouridine1911/1915/1917 synthase
MMVARSALAMNSLSSQLRHRTARRLYLAVVLGTRLPARGTFHTKYGRHPTERLRFSSRHGGSRHAVTHYEVVAQSATTSLVAIQLETGRTHQIRVHFADAGYPVAGDALYSGQRSDRSRAIGDFRAVAALKRQALHAAGLAFTHPISGEWLRFTAPLPGDLATLSQQLFGEAGETAIKETIARWVSGDAPAWVQPNGESDELWDEFDEMEPSKLEQ